MEINYLVKEWWRIWPWTNYVTIGNNWEWSINICIERLVNLWDEYYEKNNDVMLNWIKELPISDEKKKEIFEFISN